MIKEEIAPGIMVYSNVIPDSETLCQDIEEGLVSANLSWVPAEVKADKDPGVNTNSRDTSTFGVPIMEQFLKTFLIFSLLLTQH